jgi:hypothetical protein
MVTQAAPISEDILPTRIAIYGGTDLRPKVVEFVTRLTRQLLTFPDVVLVSGGFDHDERYPDRTSVDLAVLREAKRRLVGKESFAKRFETWLPAPAFDRDSIIRFRRGHVRELKGSAQARRFVVVNEVDAVVTIAGKENTHTVLELSLALGKPALPVAFTGGDSRSIWARSREDLARSLRLAPKVVRSLETVPRDARERTRLADRIARAAHDAAERRCLVLMPFGRGHGGFYDRVLKPAIRKAGFVAHRLDKDQYAGDIPTLFLSELQGAHAVLVDVTGANPNVMYELGQIHARLPTRPAVLLRERLTRRAFTGLPFYLRHERMISASDTAAGHRQIARDVENYLRRIARSRN